MLARQAHNAFRVFSRNPVSVGSAPNQPHVREVTDMVGSFSYILIAVVCSHVRACPLKGTSDHQDAIHHLPIREQEIVIYYNELCS